MAASDRQGTSRNGGTPLAFDEVRWVVQIRRSLEEDASAGDEDDDNGIPVSVFNVPKPLLVHKPEAYTPLFIALGPYRHWRPELYEMERYKLAAARRAQKRLRNGAKLEVLVTQFARLERRVRAHYHRYLDVGGETLAWMMVVDGAFLLEFLQIFAAVAAHDEGDGGGGNGNGKVLKRVSSRMAHLVDFAGRKAAHNLILRDMLMLENQVPLFLLRKILEPQCASADEAVAMLQRMVTGLMKELCPFKMMERFPAIDAGKHVHLLEALYFLLVPKDPDAEAEDNANHHDDGYDIEEQPVHGGGGGEGEDEEKAAGGGEHVKQLFGFVWGIVSGLKSKRLRYVTKPIAFAVKAPWKMLTDLPGFSAIKNPVESFFASGDASTHPNNDPNNGGHLTRPPLIEEIMVPSVSELASVGVQFSPTAGDLSTITFDAKTVTFHLPVVTLDSNTEIMPRNLVSYEATAASGPLVLARYTELMNGIIDTDEDVALLREKGVVLNRMKSDGEAAKMWNGMTRSVRLTKVAFVDRAVEEVNRYYNGQWRVKTKRFMRKYIFSSWQLLTFLAAIMMLLLTTLQAFCSVYTCSRWFGAVTVATAD